MTDASDEAVLPLHRPADPRYTLRFVSDDEATWRSRALELVQESELDPWTDIQEIDGQSVYLIYARTPFDADVFDFESEDALVEWLHSEFSDSDLPILVVILRTFDTIVEATDERDATLSTYKELDLEAMGDALNRVQWRQSVPIVGAELLSRFVLAHPMPNTNHRTGIGLLEHYLSSYDAGFVMPETGEEGRWFAWARDYIFDSKRLLTLRNQYDLLYWARECGYGAVERKEGIQIDLTTLDVDRTDARQHYTDQHIARSREFVDTVLEEADATQLREEMDDGKRAFADRLRARM